ncbi:MAG: membrane protein insertase YidC [Syntrophobacterales bacterium]|jgi:YidC/Oxa1 family membrane protein insertase|nr:membrane protein insertase YidC [Syntrophobacterales bacterium]
MEKRALIALGLSFLVFIAFIFYGEKFKRPAEPQPAAQTAPAAPAAPAPTPGPVAAQPAAPPVRTPAAVPAKDVVVDTPLFHAVFTELGGRLKSFQLKKYKDRLPFVPIKEFKLGPVSFEIQRYLNPETSGIKPKELVREGGANELPLTVSWEGKTLKVPGLARCEASTSALTVKDGDKGVLKFTCVSPEGLTIVKTFTFKGDGYGFDLAVQVVNHTAQPLDGQLNLDLSENFAGEEADRFHFLGFNGSINNKLDDIKSGGLKEPKTFTGQVQWAGLDEGYFMTAMIPESAKAWVTLSEPPKAPMVASLRNPVENLAPGQAVQFAYTLYFGPKNLGDLKTMGLERAVNFGWFDFLGKPFLTFLNWLERYSFNYGWAIVIMTILLRIVFYYPNHKSYKSMKDMQKLQPKVAKIREKYKDDKEAMNKELMALYKTFKVNPMAGCLPMVIQLPVFIALYNVLGYAIELRHASFIPTLPFTNIVWLADLSAKDPLLITPLVMGATMFLQQKMTPSAGDPTQAKMMMFLPLIFTFMFLNFASGLVIYWLVNNVLSIVQQHYTNKYLT